MAVTTTDEVLTETEEQNHDELVVEATPASNGQASPAAPGRKRNFTAAVPLGMFALLLLFPKLPFVSFSVVGVATQAGQYAIVTASLVLLTGWVGQISLGHAALVGIGGFATGWAVGEFGLPFPLNVLVPGLVAAGMAGLLGAVALRVRGLYLAVATLIFSWMADAFLFRIEAVVRHSFIEVPVIGNPESYPHFDLSNRPTMFYVTWGVVAVVFFVVANIRDSRTGRAFFAVRGSEIGASSLGIDVTKYKLLAFMFSGFLAGVAGSLLMLDARALSPDTFRFTISLFYLSMAVVGGLQSLGGALAAAILFAGLNELFFRFPALGEQLDLVSAALLAVVLLAYRGGLAAVPQSVAHLFEKVRAVRPEWLTSFVEATRKELTRLRVASGSAMRAGTRKLQRPQPTDEETADGEDAPSRKRGLGRLRSGGGKARPDRTKVIRKPVLADVDGSSVAVAELVDEPEVEDDSGVPSRGEPPRVILPEPRDQRELVLGASGITVQFGGLVAVNDVSLEVREHEIVGLIGPNGAGKTTLFNAIAGLNSPTKGTVSIFGEDVTKLAVHERAVRGVARTFQAIQLFPQLDVFSNLLVATHVHGGTGFFRHAFASDASVHAEQEARFRVAAVIDRLGLGDVQHRTVADLPFGVLRMAEVARAMVTGFPLIMLDEPASGLDNRETDRLAEMLLEIRSEGFTLLLIEHDVRMVTSVSDYMYVINRGELIADGPPAAVQRDPAVMAAYLGQPAEASGTKKVRKKKS